MIDYEKEYTISEVAEIIGYAPHVLRYYEKEFDMDIPRKDSNHRYYTYKEIEIIQYIKMLKDKGFGNKQVKLIIGSPGLVVSQEETSLDTINDSVTDLDSSHIAYEISRHIEDNIIEIISKHIKLGNEDTESLILQLKDEIISLRKEINSTERDILICENAKLKMKVKEKTYENIKIKEELSRLQSNNRGFIKRLLKSI